MSTSPGSTPRDLSAAGAPWLRWWKELAYVVAFYGVYSVVRNQFGSAAVSAVEARANAETIIRIQQAVGTYHEQTIQSWFLGARWFIQAWNLFYGTFHFVVTAMALIYLFRRFPRRYVRWRTALAWTTALALVGYATFPLMPPRLLPDSYGFVDTLAVYGGLWSFDDGPMEAVSNQYAAMPSLHFGWSTWSACALFPVVRRGWARALLVVYPVATLFAIIVTGNHFWLDAAGGALVLALGYGAARLWDRRIDRRQAERLGRVVDDPPPGDQAEAEVISAPLTPNGRAEV
ncbi:MAG TPA: phosphatase PAP2 family protein [Acidimicrobiales bacterium]|nr:phosphatase PAP2 family protein [Acidimicrobiales bacterium]